MIISVYFASDLFRSYKVHECVLDFKGIYDIGVHNLTLVAET